MASTAVRCGPGDKACPPSGSRRLRRRRVRGRLLGLAWPQDVERGAERAPHEVVVEVHHGVGVESLVDGAEPQVLRELVELDGGPGEGRDGDAEEPRQAAPPADA